jgi:hypothetical protein
MGSARSEEWHLPTSVGRVRLDVGERGRVGRIQTGDEAVDLPLEPLTSATLRRSFPPSVPFTASCGLRCLRQHDPLAGS